MDEPHVPPSIFPPAVRRSPVAGRGWARSISWFVVQ